MLEESALVAALQAVTDRHQGASFNMPALVSLTLEKFSPPDVGPTNYKQVGKQVTAYIEANVGTRESGAKFGHYENNQYSGYWVWADKPADCNERGVVPWKKESP